MQEDFFSSFGYTPPLGASAATSAATSGGAANFGSGGGGFSSAVSSIPPLATGSAGGASTSASLHASALPDRSRSPRWGGVGSGDGSGRRIPASSVSPRARSPLRRRDLDGTADGEKGDEARGSGHHRRVGTKPSRGRSGARGRSGGVGFRKDEAVPAAAAAAATTIDGASYAFPVTAPSPRAEGGARGRAGEFVSSWATSSSSPRMPGRTWRSLSPSPRTAVAAAAAAATGWPIGAVGSAR